MKTRKLEQEAKRGRKKGVKLEVRSEHAKGIRDGFSKLKTLDDSSRMMAEDFLDTGKKVLAGPAKHQLKQIIETARDLIKKLRAAEADMIERLREQEAA